MSEKYTATVRGNIIEWDGNEPDGASRSEGLKIEVTVPSDRHQRTEPDGEKMAAALKSLAAIRNRSGLKSIKDPVKWQREIRQDRPLSGR